MQSGLYQPGGAGGLPVRRKCTSFLLQMLALTFMPGEMKAIWLSEGLPAGATFFLRVCLGLQARPVRFCCWVQDPNNDTCSAPSGNWCETQN